MQGIDLNLVISLINIGAFVTGYYDFYLEIMKQKMYEEKTRVAFIRSNVNGLTRVKNNEYFFGLEKEMLT